ncbi:MAG: hypothetical protein M3017_09130 [Actinomycetota bacterium]|nr:hypothetical protein [Actinomycetota bacterium]
MVSEEDKPGEGDAEEKPPADTHADGNAEPDNPLAHVDPDNVSPSSGQGMFNDPESDPLWNPSLEPDAAPDIRGGTTKPQDEDADTPEAGSADT